MSAVLAGSYYSANVAMVAKDPKMVMSALGVTLALGVLFLGERGRYAACATARTAYAIRSIRRNDHLNGSTPPHEPAHRMSRMAYGATLGGGGARGR
jgi:hypothetical protein